MFNDHIGFAVVAPITSTIRDVLLRNEMEAVGRS